MNAIASKLEAIASRLEAIASRLSRLENLMFCLIRLRSQKSVQPTCTAKKERIPLPAPRSIADFPAKSSGFSTFGEVGCK